VGRGWSSDRSDKRRSNSSLGAHVAAHHGGGGHLCAQVKGVQCGGPGRGRSSDRSNERRGNSSLAAHIAAMGIFVPKLKGSKVEVRTEVAAQTGAT
jgi:hypothetical protein